MHPDQPRDAATVDRVEPAEDGSAGVQRDRATGRGGGGGDGWDERVSVVLLPLRIYREREQTDGEHGRVTRRRRHGDAYGPENLPSADAGRGRRQVEGGPGTQRADPAHAADRGAVLAGAAA